jgi:hypothetical protein
MNSKTNINIAAYNYIDYNDLAFRRRIIETDPRLKVLKLDVLKNEVEERQWDNAIHGKMDECIFHEVLNVTEFKQKLKLNATLRQYSGDEEYFIVNPNLDAIRIDGFFYIVHRKHMTLKNIAWSNKDLNNALFEISCALQCLHENRHIHGNIHPIVVCASYTSGKHILRVVDKFLTHEKNFTAEKYSSSIFISPLQVILEMMSSTLAPDETNYTLFKEKLSSFWKHLLTPMDNTYVIEKASKYFSFTNGCVNYIDYCIMRYCIVSEDGATVKKDIRKALGYLKDIDLFGLAMSIDLLKGNLQISSELKSYIGTCIGGSYPISSENQDT